MSCRFQLPDGRKLGYSTIGKGFPVVYFHGTASSRLEVHLLSQLTRLDIQLIGIDRPGYGLSSYCHRRSLGDFNTDVNALVDHLGLERFAILGWSGGGTFALAYLAHNNSRIIKALIASTPSLPFDAATAHNVPLARYIMKLPYIGNFAIRQLYGGLLKADSQPATFLATRLGKQLLRGATKHDLKFFHDPVWMGLMYKAMVEGFRQGNDGVKTVVEEHQLFLKHWNLPFNRIVGGKLHVWHGSEDLTCRANNAYAIAQTVSGSQLEVFGGAGHCAMFERIDQLAHVLRS